MTYRPRKEKTIRYTDIPVDKGVAFPGYPGLDVDLDGITITAVTEYDGTIVVGMRGGYGFFVNRDGTRNTVQPGTPAAAGTTGELVMAFPDGDPRITRRMISILERWRDQSVPVRFVSAPDRISLLIVDQEDWLMAPRRPFPLQEPQ